VTIPAVSADCNCGIVASISSKDCVCI
jgi:hypothetical protein